MNRPDYERGDDALLPHPALPSRWAFVCVCVGCVSAYCDALPTQPCARTQSYAPAERSGGVTVEEAELLGWRKTERGWLCPFCSGEEKGLRKVFRRASQKRRGGTTKNECMTRRTFFGALACAVAAPVTPRRVYSFLWDDPLVVVPSPAEHAYFGTLAKWVQVKERIPTAATLSSLLEERGGAPFYDSRWLRAPEG